MRLATFHHSGREKLGALSESGDALADLSADAELAALDMVGALSAGAGFLERAVRIAKQSPQLSLREVRLMAPVPRPRKILAVGLNYLNHIAEVQAQGRSIPEVPLVFNKQVTSVSGPHDDIHLPRVSGQLDYEGEFAIVIGRRGRHIPEERAGEFIAGFTIVNDFSVRDWQMASPTFTLGKSFDTHCPMGPAILTIDEVGALPDLDLATFVNGERRQRDSTAKLKFPPAKLLAHLSKVMTLEPGDIIPTGTPGGVGAAMQPQQWLRAGDVVRVEVERIGFIENTVVPEPDGHLADPAHPS
ncbi:MAG: fumarylacetoacetate hydrolase family protein [Gammaproteobacteria bacterium AqS3]|nr:fumarylacetoacetate hydrolase family protein [Gammaproteobacteria bacterium AqS3]